MTEIKAIIFDYGKVVGHFDHGRTAERLAPFSRRSLAGIRAYLYPEDLEDEFERGAVSIEQFLNVVRDQLQLQCSTETIRSAVADIFWPNPEVCDLVPRLVPRYRLVLGSNTNAIHAEHFRQLSAPVLKHFHHLILSFEVNVRKPDREFFDHCVRVAEQPAAACLFIDDLPANIAGAKSAGLQTLLYRGQNTLVAEMHGMGIQLSDVERQ
jgi:glucose-1-phosphatase